MSRKNSYDPRTIALLKKYGFNWIGKVERYISAPGISIDLFGIIDYVVLCPDFRQIIGVQSCGSDFAVHVRKLTGITIMKGKNGKPDKEFDGRSASRAWLQSGGELVIIGWSKLKKNKPVYVPAYDMKSTRLDHMIERSALKGTPTKKAAYWFPKIKKITMEDLT